MTSKIIIAGLVALAFVAGSIMTGTMADAAKEKKVDPVAAAIDKLTAVMQGTATQGPQGEQGPAGSNGENGADGAKGEQGPSAGDLTFGRLTDTATSGHLVGWNPNGSAKFFSIAEPSVLHTGTFMSVVSISLHDVDASINSLPVCSVLAIGGVAHGGASGFNISCTNAPGEHSILGYVVSNPTT